MVLIKDHLVDRPYDVHQEGVAAAFVRSLRGRRVQEHVSNEVDELRHEAQVASGLIEVEMAVVQ